jgi:class 3 adenylate cyclase
MSDRAVLDQAIAALESQRAILGDAVVNASLAAIRAQIAALTTPRPEQQRKLVTILFADVSGFTALSETLDAEDVTTVMNALWERLDAAVLMHGGRIDKHIGDALMALWGADAAREDNPEQAVRAALAMQQALADFRATQGIALAMRIGVNTGPVLLGAVGTTQEFTAMGDAVNLASRLEHAAPVDGVLISYDTLRHVQGLFEAIPQPPLTVKGKVAPVQTYVVMAAKARVFQPMSRGVEGVFTRTIGRLSKLQALQRIYDETTETPVLRMVVVVGEAGVGKSRLLREFEAWLDDHPTAPTLLRGRATLESLHRPGGLLRDLLNAFAGLWETDDLETVRQKLRVVLGPALGPGGAAVLGQAAGFDFHDDPAVQAASSADFTDLATSAIVGLLGALANEAPLAVLLEDLHWADERSLDLLDAALRQLASRPLLVLGLARPTLYERRPGWGSEPAGYLRLNLPPLSGDESAALVDEILRQAPGAPAALRAMVVEQAEGNPFYIEELIKMFLDSNVIARGATLDAPWVFNPDRLTGLTVPPTLTGVLQARLDGLPPEEKLTLQRAAVVGRAFWDEAVAALAAASETAPLIETTLNGLTARELVFRRERSAFAEAEEYSFKHALLREVAYESVLLRQRRQYHALVAGWIERISGARSNEYAALIAGAGHWSCFRTMRRHCIWRVAVLTKRSASSITRAQIMSRGCAWPAPPTMAGRRGRACSTSASCGRAVTTSRPAFGLAARSRWRRPWVSHIGWRRA